MEEKKYFYEMKSVYLNVISVVIMIIMFLITGLIMKLTGMSIVMNGKELGIFLALCLPYFMFHEVLHAIGYTVNGAKFNRITFGIHLEKGVLCCSCKQEVKKKTIMWSLIYPFMIIGVITYIIGLLINSELLILLSIANIAGCSGDLVMFFDFLKLKDFKFFEYDNPLAFGLISKENLNNKKLFGLKQIEENDFKQTVGKKITISKTSIIIIVIYTALCLINIFL